MQFRRYLSRVSAGAALLFLGGATAWTAGRGRLDPEPAPMEALLTEAMPSAGVTWDLPVTRNERVEDWIDFLKGRNADKTQLWLERSGRYGPMIQAELRRRGMPEDLLYLALIESGFSPRAYSKAAASGMWQFIAETGRRYGLSVNGELDERRDPIRSTTAALDYLQALYDRFGSWYLAAAAYNSGENRVERILRERAGSQRGADSLFWVIAPHLPRETRDYVPLMLAAGHIAKEPENYGFAPIEYQEPLAFDVVWVPGATDLALIARAAGIAEEAVKDLNPHLMRDRTPAGRGWAVRIPEGRRAEFAAHFPKLYQEVRLAAAEAPALAATTKAATGVRTHTVRRGETLGHLSRRYGVSVTALRNANGGVSPTRIRVGQKLRIPSGAVRVASAPSTRTHTVRRGENLSVIASRYDVSVRQLQSWNGMGSRNRIYAGQKLRVRGG
ncbi:MAG TPA: LysM peptidoglycan-binding domain-containing protein [Longimicrobiales bacterium]|nr:LysM peptidoglycan-binding domain-containing protein [Longimicrobiales bacterium]